MRLCTLVWTLPAPARMCQAFKETGRPAQNNATRPWQARCLWQLQAPMAVQGSIGGNNGGRLRGRGAQEGRVAAQHLEHQHAERPPARTPCPVSGSGSGFRAYSACCSPDRMCLVECSYHPCRDVGHWHARSPVGAKAVACAADHLRRHVLRRAAQREGPVQCCLWHAVNTFAKVLFSCIAVAAAAQCATHI